MISGFMQLTAVAVGVEDTEDGQKVLIIDSPNSNGDPMRFAIPMSAENADILGKGLCAKPQPKSGLIVNEAPSLIVPPGIR